LRRFCTEAAGMMPTDDLQARFLRAAAGMRMDLAPGEVERSAQRELDEAEPQAVRSVRDKPCAAPRTDRISSRVRPGSTAANGRRGTCEFLH